MKLKTQRNTWLFAGTCFLISIILHVSSGEPFDLQNILLGIACIASFFNAYKAHKKIH